MNKEPTVLETVMWIILAVFLVLLLTVGFDREEGDESCGNIIYRNNDHGKSCNQELPVEKMT